MKTTAIQPELEKSKKIQENPKNLLKPQTGDIGQVSLRNKSAVKAFFGTLGVGKNFPGILNQIENP